MRRRLIVKQKTEQQKTVDLNSLDQINLDAAGLGIGAEEIYVCALKGDHRIRCDTLGRTLPAFRLLLAGWASVR
jgi:hypothetical protein